MRLKKGALNFLVYLSFLFCLLPAAFFFYKHPAYNWDMLGYMAVVVKADGVKNIYEIHRITYSNAKQNIPSQEYAKLVETPPVRVRFANDASYFERVRPIHVVKPLYTWLVYLFYKSGFTLPIATVLPSIISFLFIGLLVFYWIKKYFVTVLAFVASLLIMHSMLMENISRESSPDNLSALFLLAAFYFIFEKPVLWMIFLFLLFSLFTRADNLINCFFILSFLRFSGKWEKNISTRNYFLMLAVLGASYLLIIFPVTQFGWSLFYYSEYLKYMDFNRDFDLPYGFSDYLSYMYSKAVTGFVNSHFAIFMFLAVLVIGNRFLTRLRNWSFDQLFALLLAFIIFVRFILLPDLSDRFYVSFYLVIIMLLIRRISLQIEVANENS